MSRDSVFDRILTSNPVNRTAGVVSSSTQTVGFTKECDGRLQKKTPIKYRAPLPDETNNPCSFQDLTGVRVGRMVVMGILDAKSEGIVRSKKKGQRWVVRCSCGNFEVRTAKAIKNPENSEMGCFACGKLMALRERSVKQARGIVPRVTVEDALARLKTKPACDEVRGETV